MTRKAKVNLPDELLRRKTFSIPSLQHELGIDYKELRDCIGELEKIGQVRLSDDELNYIVDDTLPFPNKTKENSTVSRRHSTKTGHDTFKQTEDDEGLSIDEKIARRRRELFEALAKLSKEDEDEDEYDEDDDEDDDDDEEEEAVSRVFEKTCESLKKYSSIANDCKLINDINYVEEKIIARKIENRLSCFGYKLILKAIQYGTSSIGYVFSYPSQKRNINDLNNYVDDITSVVNADKVKVVVPWNDSTIYVLVKSDAAFDPLCKKVLQYWIMRNDGNASIASVQRGLGIGFNRAGKIMDDLQKCGCVERPSASDDVSEPLHVKINLQEIDILFPEYLGWD